MTPALIALVAVVAAAGAIQVCARVLVRAVTPSDPVHSNAVTEHV